MPSSRKRPSRASKPHCHADLALAQGLVSGTAGRHRSAFGRVGFAVIEGARGQVSERLRRRASRFTSAPEPRFEALAAHDAMVFDACAATNTVAVAMSSCGVEM